MESNQVYLMKMVENNISGGSSNTVVEQRGASVRGLPPSTTDTSKTRKTAGLYLKHILKSATLSKRLDQDLLLRSRELLEEWDQKKRNIRTMKFELMTQLSKEQVSLSLDAGGFHFSFVVREDASRP